MFGDLKSGVFNSEESPEARMYESFIGTRQNDGCYKNARKLLILGAKVTGTKLMDEFDFDFVPLYDRTEKARQDELKSVRETVGDLIEMGIMTRESAFLEIQSAQKRTGFGLHLDKRDLELAKRADKLDKENPQDEGTDADAIGETLEEVTNVKQIDYNSLFKKGVRDGRR